MRLLKDKKRLEEERQSFSNAELNKLRSKNMKKIRKSYDIPNYDDLYKKFTSEVEAKRYEGQTKTTVCKPFSLHTSSRAKMKENNSRISSAQSNSSRQSVIFNDSINRLRNC